MAAIDPGQSKVSQLHLALAGHQDVLWLQVPMHDTIRVKECQTAQQLPHQVLHYHTHKHTFNIQTRCNLQDPVHTHTPKLPPCQLFVQT